MEIKAKVYKSKQAWLKGMASITIDNCFVVKGIKIIESKNGLFVAMPSKKQTNGEYSDICFPITAEARQQINEAILNEYNNLENYVPNDEEVIQPEQLNDDELPF